jgi:hypothetical protein
MASSWQRIGYVDGKEWEAKIPNHRRFALVRPVGNYSSDDPHCRVDLDSNGNPNWSTFHSNFNGYFGMQEVVKTAITIALGL